MIFCTKESDDVPSNKRCCVTKKFKTENGFDEQRNASGVLMMVRCRELKESKSVAPGGIPF